MKQSPTTSGYILVLAVLILSMSVMLITHIVSKTITFTRFTHLASDRERAKLLAESGVEIALAELTLMETSTEKNTTNQLTAQLPFLNTWQTFTLTTNYDGIDGTCKLYISCEEGKIDINALYDFEKKSWRKEEPKVNPFKPAAKPVAYDAKKAITLLGEKLTSSFGNKNPVEILDQIFKTRKEPIEDLSILLTAKNVPTQRFVMFPEPSDTDKSIAISDIFTVFTNKKEIQPLMLSSGIIKALGFKPPQRNKESLGFIKKIKPTMQWESSWHDTLAPWYGVEYSSIAPEIQLLLASKFEGKTFSVVSYGIIGSLTQKLCVVLQQEGGLQGQQQPRYIIKRWYWL